MVKFKSKSVDTTQRSFRQWPRLDNLVITHSLTDNFTVIDHPPNWYWLGISLRNSWTRLRNSLKSYSSFPKWDKKMSVTNDCQFYIDCKKCYHRAKQETKCVKCGETRFVERVPLDRVRPVESLSAELGQLFVDSRGIVHKVKKKVKT